MLVEHSGDDPRSGGRPARGFERRRGVWLVEPVDGRRDIRDRAAQQDQSARRRHEQAVRQCAAEWLHRSLGPIRT
jgi:hypothetical protein